MPRKRTPACAVTMPFGQISDKSRLSPSSCNAVALGPLPKDLRCPLAPALNKGRNARNAPRYGHQRAPSTPKALFLRLHYSYWKRDSVKYGLCKKGVYRFCKSSLYNQSWPENITWANMTL